VNSSTETYITKKHIAYTELHNYRPETNNYDVIRAIPIYLK